MENNNNHAQSELEKLESEIEKKGTGGGRKKILFLTLVGFLFAAFLATFYLYLTSGRIYIEKSYVEAPIIELSSGRGGVLRDVLVKPGDKVAQNQIVAQVGQELIKAEKSGTIIRTSDSFGKTFLPGEAVVSMIIPEDLEIVARVEEDKGLDKIQVGQKAFFTVDAFGSQKFEGVVDEVSPTSRDSDVVFNISSQREVREFNVKIRFDIAAYPQLKNGMSAKTWVYMN